MPFSARVLLDSVSPAGVRLTTMEVRYPRFIHSEMMTHRVFCLDAGTRLYFDLPSGGHEPKRYSLTIAELHEKWHSGAASRPGKKRVARVDGIDPQGLYTSREAARALGYAHYTTVNANVGRAKLPRVRGEDGRNRFSGVDLIAYANGSSEHRYSLRRRLARMRLRSCDESTRKLYHTNISNVTFSGYQPVFRITSAEGHSITATAEHRFLTQHGWSSLRESADLALSPSGIASWRRPLKLAVNGTDALRDREWLQEMRDKGFSAPMIAEHLGVSLDQVKYRFRRYAIPATNASEVRVCRPRRILRKRAQVAHFVDVIAIEYVGVRPTYDLEVSGPYHNFVADGFIVHNSRNAASSRAIPIKKMIDAVRLDPAMPLWWGRNQSGMQANQQVGSEAREQAEAEWRGALEDALRHAERLSSAEINLHKQLVNRILEPFAWITVILTATEWSNFFAQRMHGDAQPELKHLAELMFAAYHASNPSGLGAREWHTPLLQPDEIEDRQLDVRLT